MAKKDIIKFRHGNHKGMFHYTVFEDQFLALSELKTGKVDYIKEHGSLDITFDLKSETYDKMAVDVMDDQDLVKRVYDFMLENDNNYFKDGYDHLVVLKFHK